MPYQWPAHDKEVLAGQDLLLCDRCDLLSCDLLMISNCSAFLCLLLLVVDDVVVIVAAVAVNLKSYRRLHATHQ